MAMSFDFYWSLDQQRCRRSSKKTQKRAHFLNVRQPWQLNDAIESQKAEFVVEKHIHLLVFNSAGKSVKQLPFKLLIEFVRSKVVGQEFRPRFALVLRWKSLIVEKRPGECRTIGHEAIFLRRANGIRSWKKTKFVVSFFFDPRNFFFFFRFETPKHVAPRFTCSTWPIWRWTFSFCKYFDDSKRNVGLSRKKFSDRNESKKKRNVFFVSFLYSIIWKLMSNLSGRVLRVRFARIS